MNTELMEGEGGGDEKRKRALEPLYCAQWIYVVRGSSTNGSANTITIDCLT
jgi:hypothetical protein